MSRYAYDQNTAHACRIDEALEAMGEPFETNFVQGHEAVYWDLTLTPEQAAAKLVQLRREAYERALNG